MAEAVDDPIEVALAEPVALRLRDRRPTAMLTADGRDLDGHGPARSALLAFIAQDEAPPHVEVPVEAEPLVERAAGRGIGSAEGDRVAADCRHVAEPECAVRAAVDAGTVSDARYDSYLRLLEELEAG